MRYIKLGPVAIVAVCAALLALSLGSAAIGGALVITTCSTGAPCIGGTNTGTGDGVRGISSAWDGVVGMTQTGPAGVFGSSTNANGVTGKTTNGDGVSGTSSTGVGVSGVSTSYAAMMASSSSSDGLDATAGGTGTGVYAASSTGYGVYAVTGGSDAVYAGASGSNAAVRAAAATGFGLEATNASGSSVPAAYMSNSSGNGTDSSGSYIGIVGRAPASGGFPLVATDSSGNNLFYVDGGGNVSYHGSLSHFAITRHGRLVRAYAPSNPAPSIETTGSATLVNGSAAIAFDPGFADTIDGTRYQVMLTPDGDTRGLYVARKEPNGFVVREVQGGRGSFAFDYHVYAADVSVQPALVQRAPHAPVVHPRADKPHVPPQRHRRTS